MIPCCNNRAIVSEQDNQEQAEISSDEDNPIHEIIEDEVILINSDVSAIAKSISNCIVPETIIDISNANYPDVKNNNTWYNEIELSDQMVQIIAMA